MTGQVKTALAACLRNAGVSAMRAFEEERLKRYGTSVAVVGARETRVEHMGMLDYLGSTAPQNGEQPREIYGRTLTLTLSADVYTPRELGRGDGEQTAETITEALMGDLPEALRITRITWGQSAWDTRSGMFLLPGTVECTAIYTAEARPEEAVLRQFILRGMVSE